jgi:hypothetical protein
LVKVGLRELLQDDFARYAAASADNKREVLIAILNDLLRRRPAGIYASISAR